MKLYKVSEEMSRVTSIDPSVFPFPLLLLSLIFMTSHGTYFLCKTLFFNKNVLFRSISLLVRLFWDEKRGFPEALWCQEVCVGPRWRGRLRRGPHSGGQGRYDWCQGNNFHPVGIKKPNIHYITWILMIIFFCGNYFW